MRGRGALHIDAFLHRHWYSAERSDHFARCYAPIGGVRRSEGFIREHRRHCVQSRVDSLDSPKVCFDNLSTGKLTLSDLRGQFCCTHLPDFAHMALQAEAIPKKKQKTDLYFEPI
jgi:hypothetical protein